MFHGPGPGRPKGSPNKKTTEVRDACRRIVEDPEYREKLIVRLKCGLAPHMETLLWHYAYGKPKETVEVTGEVALSKVVREIVRAEDDEAGEQPSSVH